MTSGSRISLTPIGAAGVSSKLSMSQAVSELGSFLEHWCEESISVTWAC